MNKRLLMIGAPVGGLVVAAALFFFVGLRAPEDALIRCVLTLHDDPEATTANLVAPIVLNRRTRKGRQVILQGTSLSMRYPVFESLSLAAEA